MVITIQGRGKDREDSLIEKVYFMFCIGHLSVHITITSLKWFWVGWLSSVLQALGRLRQEICHECEVSLGYNVRLCVNSLLNKQCSLSALRKEC